MAGNLDYLYNSFTVRYRAADKTLLLRRFLTWYAETLDGFDETRDNLNSYINPDTAPEEWLDYILSLFGWGWFPANFPLARKRLFLKNIARIYAKRGTLTGIQELLNAFGVRAIVEAPRYYWEDETWGDDIFLISDPLFILVRQLANSPLTPNEVDQILRFEWPVGHMVIIEELPQESQQPLWGEGLFGQ